jgi:hypothetical protein
MGYQRLGLMRDGEFLDEATPKLAPEASRRSFHGADR